MGRRSNEKVSKQEAIEVKPEKTETLTENDEIPLNNEESTKSDCITTALKTLESLFLRQNDEIATSVEGESTHNISTFKDQENVLPSAVPQFDYKNNGHDSLKRGQE